MNGDPDERAQPDGGRAPDEFEAIVAGWRQEGGVPVWPGSDAGERGAASLFEPAPLDPGPFDRGPYDPAPLDPAPLDPARSDPAQLDPAPADPFASDRARSAASAADDEHFVPPEPPPLPRLGPPAIVGLVLLLLGLVLVAAPGWVGVGPVYGLPLGLLSLAAGLGWLVLRLWPDGDGEGGEPSGGPDDDRDDGAVL